MKLEKEEFKEIKKLREDYQAAKDRVGSLEIEKHSTLTVIQAITREFKRIEKELVQKYGHDAVINFETGDITKAKKNGKNK